MKISLLHTFLKKNKTNWVTKQKKLYKCLIIVNMKDNNTIGNANCFFYKRVDLFGEEEIIISKSKKRVKKNLFNDYNAFIEKFEDKKTTDDCETPKEVMEIVINYVNEKFPLKGYQIIRPFYKGGDFESIEYTEDMVVIDNPPFSICAKICKFYIERGIKFFLFCPHLTAFSSDIDCTLIIASADITYANGAIVKTAFASNMFGDLKIIGDANLHMKFKEIKQRKKSSLPKYEYPKNIVTVSRVSSAVEKGINVKFRKNQLKHYKKMDAQKKHGKGIFGSGFICSDKSASELETALETALETEKKDNLIVWELSEKEKAIINSF